VEQVKVELLCYFYEVVIVNVYRNADDMKGCLEVRQEKRGR